MLANVGHILMDKTGTITKGKFEVVEVAPNGVEEKSFGFAYLGERHSTHPIAKSNCKLCKRLCSRRGSKRTKRNSRKRKGMQYEYDNKTVYVGNSSLLRDNSIEFNDESFYGV